MGRLRRLCVLTAFVAAFSVPPLGQAATMCYGARVQMGAWSDGTRWCSPISPYSVQCVGPGVSNSNTGQTIAVTTEACYPTRLW